MEPKSRRNFNQLVKSIYSNAPLYRLRCEKKRLTKNIAILEDERLENIEEIAKLNKKQQNLIAWINNKKEKLEQTNSLIIKELEQKLADARDVIQAQTIERPLKQILENNAVNATKILKTDTMHREPGFPNPPVPQMNAATKATGNVVQQHQCAIGSQFCAGCRPLSKFTNPLNELKKRKHIEVGYENRQDFISNISPLPSTSKVKLIKNSFPVVLTEASAGTVAPNVEYKDEGVKSDLKVEITFLGYSLLFRIMSVLKAAETYEIKQNHPAVLSFKVPAELFFYLGESKHTSEQNEYRIVLRLRRSPQTLLEIGDTVRNSVRLIVNGHYYTKECVDLFEMPIDVTRQCLDKLSNEIIIEAGPRNYVEIVAGVYFVRLITVSEAMNIFEHKAEERLMIEGLEAVQEMFYLTEGTPETIPLPLTCPLSKRRIIIPCLGNECIHAECFDLKSFLEKHHKQLLWKCPICNEAIEEFVRDKLFANILATVSLNCTQIEFNERGEWNEVGYRHVKHVLSLN